jgi:type II secretory pathway pseudopilin PulG
MVDPRTGPRGETGGFTLAEMLVALGILLFGVTALLGALSSSVGQRRTTDARHELVALCEHVVLRVQQEAGKARDGSLSPLDLEFVPLVDQPAPGFPGMRWTARAQVDETRPTLWLVRIEVRWLDAGEEVLAEFLRVVPRQLPLRERVAAFREGGSDGVGR